MELKLSDRDKIYYNNYFNKCSKLKLKSFIDCYNMTIMQLKLMKQELNEKITFYETLSAFATSKYNDNK